MDEVRLICPKWRFLIGQKRSRMVLISSFVEDPL